MIDIETLIKFYEKSVAGDKLMYFKGRTGWSKSLAYREQENVFEKMQKSGRFDFLQKKVGSYNHIGSFEYYAIRRKEPLKCIRYFD